MLKRPSLFYLFCSVVLIAQGSLFPVFADQQKINTQKLVKEISTFQKVINFIGLCWLGPGCKILTHNPQLPKADYHVDVNGKQWAWAYTYKDKDLNAMSLSKKAYGDNTNKNQTIVLPKGKNTRLSFSSQDVIHNWSVSKLALSVDVIPGRLETVSINPEQVGTYQGKCAELCGANHDKMTFVVKVVPVEEFEQWLQK